ncbi:MAG: thiamine phosphate synthase [Planctomycetia bacterium]|nr:thiamine phosphate synthase [Planctomycetia bacterium]
MKFDKSILQVYAVSDGERTGEKELRTALASGVSCVQLREKNLDFDTFLQKAKTFESLCREFGVPLFINDNLEIAKRVQTAGLHLGQEDGSLKEARLLLGSRAIIGRSVHNCEEAIRAWQEGADYLGVGALFATRTKEDATVVPRDVLIDICHAVPIPVVAIGGITRENIQTLYGTGICGVALVSALFGQPDIAAAVTEMKQLTRPFST